MKRLYVALVAAAAVVLALVLLSLIANLEKVERTVRTPPGVEALRNPLLAAERFLRRMGVESASAERLAELPPTDHVLILAVENRILTRARAERLLEWMGRGGFLVVGPYLEDGEPTAETWNDRLLEALGVGVEEYVLDPEHERREVVELAAFLRDETLKVEFLAGFGLTIVDEEEEPRSYAMVWGDYGHGRYAVLNDLQFLRSGSIGQHDHAAFLWDLVQWGGRRGGALLVHGWGRESIWSLLLRHGWPALPGAALLLVAWLWARATRFGPPIPAPVPGSRSLLEHVDGLGWFLWRAGRSDALADSARRALRRRVLTGRPDFATLSRERQVQVLAVGTELPRRTIAAAWLGGRPRRPEEFTRTIRTLERLRRRES